jgi:hypothetical protein
VVRHTDLRSPPTTSTLIDAPSATNSSVASNADVAFCQLVPTLAPTFAISLDVWMFSTTNVLAKRHWLEVLWIDTIVLTTEMIQRQIIRNLTDE